ncbi:MAG: hypothetical protein Q8K55_05275 [Gemmatimonadaceae bacterium]|nr:hypothetical protein [Gemmatimonadaceae bacterium]
MPPLCLARPRVLVVVALSIVATSLPAQQREFSAQDLFLPSLGGRDARLGRAVADAARSRLLRLVNPRDVVVMPGWRIDLAVTRSGFGEKSLYEPWLLHWLAQIVRADEYVRGTAERTSSGVRVVAALVLTRDKRLYQPLPVATGGTIAEAGERLARAIADARRQMVHQRRCENAVRLGEGRAAVTAAREGLQAYPQGSLLRVCEVVALMLARADAHELLQAAGAVLAEQPDNYWALEASATAYDALKDRPRAASFWLRVAATDSSSVEIAAHVGRQLAEHDNALVAEPFILRASDAHPGDLALARVRFDVLYRNQNWPLAIATAERLSADDSVSRADPLFRLRLAAAFRNSGQPVRALEAASRAVTDFPDEPRLYELYAQLVREEAPVVVGRGLASFPGSAALNVMQARDLKAAGRSADALAASRRALAADPTLPHGYLQLAQSQIELSQPDSALVSLRLALATGEDTATVSQYALARGNAMFRAASAGGEREDFTRALRLLAFADSLRTSVQSQFLFGAATLAVLQNAATDAPALRRCDLARQARDLMPLATEKLTAGAAAAPDAARQYLQRLDQMAPIIERQVEALCTSSGTP